MPMSLDGVIDVLQARFPTHTIELYEALQLLIDALDQTVDAVNAKHGQVLQQRDFDSVRALTELSESLVGYEEELHKIIGYVNASKSDFLEIEPEADVEEYLVDKNVVHTLFEDFTHTRPYGFDFMGNFYKVRTWREALLKLCVVLSQEDINKVQDFQYNADLNGKRKPYFSDNPSDLRTPIPMEKTTLYFEGKMSANSIRNLIVKVLQQFGYNTASFKIYLRADYSSKWR